MSSGFIKHVFLGSNTPLGFYSFFSYLIDPHKATHLYIIKGGPGTGKSSFMKRIGNYAINQGFNVEYHHCSSDPHSLDGLVIPALGVAFVDGTAPHIVDPKFPGVSETILHFGAYWEEEKLLINKDAIIKTSEKISALFTKTYFYLAAAKCVYDSYVFTESQCIRQQAKQALENQLFKDLFNNLDFSDTKGSSRHLFSTSLSCDGIVDYLHTIIGDTKNVYFLKETLGCNTKQVMERLKNHALLLGLDIECYHSPIDPEKIDDLYIPHLDTIITVSSPIHKPKVFPTHIYDFTDVLDAVALKQVDIELDRDKKLFMDLIDKGVSYLATEKKLHDVLENYYIDAVDFSKIDHLFDQLILTLFKKE